MRATCCLFIMAFLTFQAGLACADWNFVGPADTSLNIDNTQDASYPAIAASASTVYVAWQENNKIYVKYYNGASWNQAGGTGALNMCNTQAAYYPDVAMIDDQPWVTWTERDYGVSGGRWAIFMKRLATNNVWVQVGGAANRVFTQDAVDSRIAAASNGMPYLTWIESETVDSVNVNHVVVKHWNGNAWLQDGGILNRSNTQNAIYATIAVAGTTPYVSWQEREYPTGTARDGVYVKKLNGTSWELVEDLVNKVAYKNAAVPAIAINVDMATVTWYENDVVSGVNQIYFAKDEAFWARDWTPAYLNMNTDQNAYNPSAAVYEFKNYVAWHEYDSSGGNAQVHVRVLNDPNWEFLGSTLNANMTYNALSPRIAFRGNAAYAAWYEAPVTPNSTPQRVFVKFYATPTPTITQTFTITPTFTITLTATPTYTRTLTSTISPTPSVTPTYTSTRTPTATLTVSRTPTRTVTITQTATITPFTLPNSEIISYPSPASGNAAWFYYYVAKPSDVKIEIFNVLGERALVLNDHHETVGYQRTRWDIQTVASGVYLYRLVMTNADGTQTSSFKKMMIVKK